jgi:hypothetical protein
MLCGHLQKKWRLEFAGAVSVLLMMVLGILLPAITSTLVGFYDNFFEIAFMYTSVATLVIIMMIFANADITVSRMIYEARYSIRLLKFIVFCYHNIQHEYKRFVLTNFVDRDDSFTEYDHTIVSTIFFKIFSMYFHTMDEKMKNPEPYLIDMQEMKDLYKSKSFNDFYSSLFFNPTMTDRDTPYEQVLVDILDGVLTKLYSKPWFVDYYNDEIVFGMVKYILSHWYGNIVTFRSCQPIGHSA